ncbi:MAG: amidohydrolase, partial [Candidatus Arcticimaribacter sp.]
MKQINKLLLLSLVILGVQRVQSQSKSKIKKEIIKTVDAHQDAMIEVSDGIWEAAETSLIEFKSSEYLMTFAEENGFTVEKGVAGIPTAFTATYGTGKPVIGILGEFDANAGISQKRQPTREIRVPGGAGHGCGHNLFGTASLGAAIAIKEQIEKGTLKGTIV